VLVHMTIKVNDDTDSLTFLAYIKKEHGQILSYTIEFEKADLPEFINLQIEAEAQEQANEAKLASSLSDNVVQVKQYVRAKAKPTKKKIESKSRIGITMSRMLDAFVEVDTVLSSAELQEILSLHSSVTSRTCGSLCRAKYLVKLEKGLYKRIK
jgi:hypothetical protein